jgi:hypothetical protein
LAPILHKKTTVRVGVTVVFCYTGHKMPDFLVLCDFAAVIFSAENVFAGKKIKAKPCFL